MIKHRLTQGQPEWHQFRQVHFGSSEAAAMLGISPYLNRNALLDQKSTGKSKEYSDWVQKNILDYGHEVESLAREIIESELDDDLFPITCSDEKLSASCDGLTLDGKIAMEHKQFNQDSFGLVQNGEVPEHHIPQCQQILMVTGAEKLIFVVSDGTKENMASVEVFPDQSWFDRIRSGWTQFQKDLVEYQPREIADKPEPEAIMQLPALSIQIKGEVTVSNLPEFKQAAETFISKINTDLTTDEDFVNAEATVKFCDETEKKLDSAKAAAIGQTASIDELMRTIDHIRDQIRSKRLTLDKLVKTQKENIKKNIIDEAYKLCAQHAESCGLEFEPKVSFMSLSANIASRQNFETACKNKRTLASLHNAVDTEVAAIKIKLDDIARIIRKNLTHLPEDLSLFRDLQSIITKQEDDFKLLVESRLADQKRKEDEAAKRAIAEAKAAEEKRIADEKMAIEQAQVREQILKDAEAARIEKESQAKAESDARIAEQKRKEEAARAADIEYRSRVIDEATECLVQIGNRSAKDIVQAIIDGKIKHISINF